MTTVMHASPERGCSPSLIALCSRVPFVYSGHRLWGAVESDCGPREKSWEDARRGAARRPANAPCGASGSPADDDSTELVWQARAAAGRRCRVTARVSLPLVALGDDRARAFQEAGPAASFRHGPGRGLAAWL